jgi:hypothetical protein
MHASLRATDSERTVEFEFVRAAENATLNVLPWLGRGDKERADAAATGPPTCPAGTRRGGGGAGRRALFDLQDGNPVRDRPDGPPRPGPG